MLKLLLQRLFLALAIIGLASPALAAGVSAMDAPDAEATLEADADDRVMLDEDEDEYDEEEEEEEEEDEDDEDDEENGW